VSRATLLASTLRFLDEERGWVGARDLEPRRAIVELSRVAAPRSGVAPRGAPYG